MWAADIGVRPKSSLALLNPTLQTNLTHLCVYTTQRDETKGQSGLCSALRALSAYSKYNPPISPIIKIFCKNVLQKVAGEWDIKKDDSATQLKPTGDIHLPPGCHTFLLIFQAFLVLQHLCSIKHLPIFVVVVALQSSGLQMWQKDFCCFTKDLRECPGTFGEGSINLVSLRCRGRELHWNVRGNNANGE